MVRSVWCWGSVVWLLLVSRLNWLSSWVASMFGGSVCNWVVVSSIVSGILSSWW